MIFGENLTLNLKSLALALKGGPGGTPGKAAGRPGGFRGAEPPYTPKNYFCPPSKEKFGIFGHFELWKCRFWAILGPPDFGNLHIWAILSPSPRILVENTHFLASLALLWPQQPPLDPGNLDFPTCSDSLKCSRGHIHHIEDPGQLFIFFKKWLSFAISEPCEGILSALKTFPYFLNTQTCMQQSRPLASTGAISKHF